MEARASGGTKPGCVGDAERGDWRDGLVVIDVLDEGVELSDDWAEGLEIGVGADVGGLSGCPTIVKPVTA